MLRCCRWRISEREQFFASFRNEAPQFRTHQEGSFGRGRGSGPSREQAEKLRLRANGRIRDDDDDSSEPRRLRTIDRKCKNCNSSTSSSLRRLLSSAALRRLPNRLCCLASWLHLHRARNKFISSRRLVCGCVIDLPGGVSWSGPS